MTPAQAFTMASRLVKYRRNILKNNLKHVNVLHFFNRPNKFIGEVAFKKFVVYVEKIKYKFKAVYVKQGQANGASVAKWLAHLPFTSKAAGSNLSENFSM
jgi:hypothetical protein